MFYSHEMLTSRKHGVATIWLMATLGSKSTHKKVTRKAILDVDLPKACETISEPQLPLALRLQGSLLFGISRVFGQQCDYMRADIENLVAKIRGRPFQAKHTHIDREVETSRFEQLNLANDPAFDVDVAIGFDLTIFGLPEESSAKSNIISPKQPGSSQSSLQVLDDVTDEQLWVQLRSPQPEASAFPSTIEDEQQFPSQGVTDAGLGLGWAEQAIFDDGDILVTDDGSLVFNDLPLPTMPFTGSDMRDELAGSAQESVVPISATDEPLNAVESGRSVGSGPVSAPDTTLATTVPGISEYVDTVPEPEAIMQQTAVEAPQRSRRPVNPRKPDLVVELENRQLSEWNSNYLQAVTRGRWAKHQNQSLAQAKRTAAFWVLGQGIGGVEVNFGDELESHPLAVLSGRALLDLLSGTSQAQKRSRSASFVDEDEEERSKSRQRSGGLELDQQSPHRMMPDIDEGINPVFSDYQPEPEVGRQAPSSLKDYSSRMPWNVSSNPGSVRPYGSAFHQASSGFGSSGAFHLGPPPNAQRFQRRLTSASPLMGRGRPLSRSESLHDMSSQGLPLDVGTFDDLDEQLGHNFAHSFYDDRPVAIPSDQQMLVDSRLGDVLEAETLNFLAFLDDNIQSHLATTSNDDVARTTYQTLLSPRHTSHVVATQGFLNLLTLATHDLIEVAQREHFGDIVISLVH